MNRVHTQIQSIVGICNPTLLFTLPQRTVVLRVTNKCPHCALPGMYMYLFREIPTRTVLAAIGMVQHNCSYDIYDT